MEPRIQYAKTRDGANIAYWTMGEGGTPLVLTSPVVWTHVSLELDNAPLRSWYERLASNRTIVRFDYRGFGMSERAIESYSADSFRLDLHAVVDQLAVEHVDLVGFYGGAIGPVVFSAENPECVDRLVLWSASASGRDAFSADRLQAVLSLIERDWHLFIETLSHTFFRWSGDRRAGQLAEFARESVTPEDGRRFMRDALDIDLRPFLPRIKAKTLVVTNPRIEGYNPEIPTELASAIPDASLARIQERGVVPWEATSGVEALEEFLGYPPQQADPTGEPLSGTAIILFADIVDSTRLTEQLGDDGFREKARQLDQALRSIVREADGTPIEGRLLGDGVLSVFRSARNAIEAAMRFGSAGEAVGLGLHLGLHAGDVIAEDGNVFGGAVNIAARIAAASAPGEVLVSDTLRGLARTSAGVAFEDRGEHQLKGIEDSQRLYAVRGAGN